MFGAFVCQECRTTVGDVEQQFKYTEVRSPPSTLRQLSRPASCRTLKLTLSDLCLSLLPSADHVPEPDVLEPHGLDAQRRAVKVFGLAEGPNPGESQRDSYR